MRSKFLTSTQDDIVPDEIRRGDVSGRFSNVGAKNKSSRRNSTRQRIRSIFNVDAKKQSSPTKFDAAAYPVNPWRR